ncbi:MAG TPA: DUF1993 domain-containing protein [Steroidobacteraceae bacterium]
MQISMYQACVPTFIHTLKNLKSILQKGIAYAEARQFDPNVLAGARLFPDMLPLTRQVQIASDAAKFAVARLGDIEAPKFEDNETTMLELIARVEKTITFLESVKPEQIDGSEDRTITLKTRSETFTCPGLIYLRHWALPNFFFHVTTAYDLLRHNGVEIGKADFIGRFV